MSKLLRVSGDRHSCLDQVGGSGILGNALKSQWLLSDAQVSNMVIEGPQTGGKGYRTNLHVGFGARTSWRSHFRQVQWLQSVVALNQLPEGCDEISCHEIPRD